MLNVKNKNIIIVCLGFFIPLENFSLIWRRYHYRWRAANFDVCLELMNIEQWGFFSVPHLLWHGASNYNGHLRGPVTLIPFAERLAVELSLHVFTTCLSRLGFEHLTLRLRCERSHRLRHRRGKNLMKYDEFQLHSPCSILLKFLIACVLPHCVFTL